MGKTAHYFKSEHLPDETMRKIEDIVDIVDSSPGVMKTNARVTKTERSLAINHFNNESGWIIGSFFVPKIEGEQKKFLVDVGYKLNKISIELQRMGVSTGFATYSLDTGKAKEEVASKHFMEYDAPLGLAFGIENKRSLLNRLIDFVYNDSYRLPLESIVEGDLTQLRDVLEDVRQSPSAGNSQTWRMVVSTPYIHFFNVSNTKERWFNIGIALAAFEDSIKTHKLNGTWETASIKKEELEYVTSFKISHSRKTQKK